MPEQRKQMRRRTLLGGHITIEKLNGWTLDCTVRNVSPDGARLAIPEHVVVPELFSLKISDHESRTARLVWCRGGQAGVELLRPRADPSLEPRENHCADDAANPVDARAPSDRLTARIAAIAGKRPQGPSLTA